MPLRIFSGNETIEAEQRASNAVFVFLRSESDKRTIMSENTPTERLSGDTQEPAVATALPHVTNVTLTDRRDPEVHVATKQLEEYEADELRLVEQMKEELAQEALKVAEELNYDELPNPFDADWESAPDDVKQRYYDALSKESYAEWCRKNPLPKKDRKYIIDKLIPSYQCHVVCGESGAQKTSILLTLLDDWMLGKDVLGRGSFPVPMLYIAYDRGREATEETFETLGLDHRVFGYVEVTSEDRKLDVAEFIAKLKEENPSVDLFVIDGMFLMAPDVLKVKTKKGDRELRDPYKVHGAWLQEIDALCNKLKITIIGVHHASKGGASEHAGKRTRILGTVANAATTGTTIICDPIQGNERRTRVTVRPRCGAPETWYFERQANGKMALVDPEVEAENLFEKFLSEQTGSFTTADVEDATGVAEATARRYTAKAVKDGRLTKEGQGKSTKYVRKKAVKRP